MSVANLSDRAERKIGFRPFWEKSISKGFTMRNSLIIAALLAFAAGGALAQAQNPPAKDGPQNSAINSSDSSNRKVDAPVAGRNSFTQGEAKSRIEKMGFSNVTGLYKDHETGARVVAELERSGIPHSDIAIISNNQSGWFDRGGSKRDRDADGV